MSNEQAKLPESTREQVPLCLHCLDPVDPLAKVCPHCGGAVGQLTPYLPFEAIRWEAGIWGQMWRQVWRGSLSPASRTFRFLIIVWFAPVLLVGSLRWIRKL